MATLTATDSTSTSSSSTNAVTSPKHYEIAPGVEAMDVIEATLTAEQFKGYLLGNLLKYRLRAGNKDDLQQDINKANEYKRRLDEKYARDATLALAISLYSSPYVR